MGGVNGQCGVGALLAPFAALGGLGWGQGRNLLVGQVGQAEKVQQLHKPDCHGSLPGPPGPGDMEWASHRHLIFVEPFWRRFFFFIAWAYFSASLPRFPIPGVRNAFP